MKLLWTLLALTLLLAGCSSDSGYFEPSESEKITDRERFHLYDYARGMILSSKKLKLTGDDKKSILGTDPQTRIHYTAPKKGTIQLIWQLASHKMLLVSADGELALENGSPVWQLKLVRGTRTGSQDPKKFGLNE